MTWRGLWEASSGSRARPLRYPPSFPPPWSQRGCLGPLSSLDRAGPPCPQHGVLPALRVPCTVGLSASPTLCWAPRPGAQSPELPLRVRTSTRHSPRETRRWRWHRTPCVARGMPPATCPVSGLHQPVGGGRHKLAGVCGDSRRLRPWAEANGVGPREPGHSAPGRQDAPGRWRPGPSRLESKQDCRPRGRWPWRRVVRRRASALPSVSWWLARVLPVGSQCPPWPSSARCAGPVITASAM